jgi:hypothetical protein
MTPSQRTFLLSLASGALGFVVLFALGVTWYLAAGLGVLLTLSAWFTLNYLTPADSQSELDANFGQIDKAAARIRRPVSGSRTVTRQRRCRPDVMQCRA